MFRVTRAQLVHPSKQYQQSLAAYAAEVRVLGEDFNPWVLEKASVDIDAYLSWLERQSKGIDLQPGFVPSSTYWLLDSSSEIVAVANLRHTLTDDLLSFGGHIGFGVRPSVRRQGYGKEILHQTLIQARKRGIHDVLVTCDKGNIGSKKIIISNGGKLSSEEYLSEHSGTIQRYWIRGE